MYGVFFFFLILLAACDAASGPFLRNLQVDVSIPSTAPTASPTPHAHCSVHQNCVGLGFTEGWCCPMRDGSTFMECCNLAQCAFHPECAAEGFSGVCCPNDAGFHMECCDTEAPSFAPTAAPTQ